MAAHIPCIYEYIPNTYVLWVVARKEAMPHKKNMYKNRVNKKEYATATTDDGVQWMNEWIL